MTGEIIEARHAWRRPQWGWLVTIRFRYTIDGLTFEGDRIGFWRRQTYWSPEAAQEVVSRYPKGQRVILWVSPSNRAQAVMEPGVGWRIYKPLLLGALCVAGGIYQFQR